MSEAIDIRTAHEGDLAWVEELLRECGLPVGGVAQGLTGGFVIAEIGGAPVGVCGVEVSGSCGLMRSLAVSPPHRGRSAGRILMEDRMAWAKTRGVRELYLLTTDASRYFERFGFARVARDGVPHEIRGSLEFSSLCPATAVVMVKSLDDPESA